MPTIPFDAVIFDCDGTLSQLEGIVELARWNNAEQAVDELTHTAMSLTGLTSDIYEKRLALTKPSLSQCETLAKAYYEHRTSGIDEVLETLQAQSIPIFVISAGVNPSVIHFAKKLGIPQAHAYGVDLIFDANGEYLNFDRNSPMTIAGGKRVIVKQIKKEYPRIAYIGDGQNDLDVKNDVSCFVGYGGAYYRAEMDKACEHYIKTKSILGFLDILKH
jgi:phosphoserine phosphatase